MEQAGLATSVLDSHRYGSLPSVVMLIDSTGLPVWPATLFLASQAISSRGQTGDTARTYGESLIPWLEFLEVKKRTVDTVDEEVLKLFRAQCVHGTGQSGQQFASATANLRVEVATQFHRWCQSNGFPSALGRYLSDRPIGSKTLAPRVIRRHPKLLSFEESKRLLHEAREPYKLMFQWGLVTGLRRSEVGSLRRSSLPRPEAVPFFADGLARFELLRKGGRSLTVYAPVNLVEQTNWYLLAERPPALPEFEDYIFINSRGRPISRQSMSREFRRCANSIGSEATLHHLRHTFAAQVLSFLDRPANRKESVNALKVVQVLLGHSRMETTEIYLTALEVADASVVQALEYLYGGAL